MYYFGYDPQTAKSYFCERCGKEHYYQNNLCHECEEAGDEDEEEKEI